MWVGEFDFLQTLKGHKYFYGKMQCSTTTKKKNTKTELFILLIMVRSIVKECFGGGWCEVPMDVLRLTEHGL